jgi:hypothetical protein
MPTLPFYPWEPDKGPLSNTSIDQVMNLNPLANGWGPFPDLVETGSALPGQCHGAWYARASDGSFKLFAGTQTGLYRFNTATLVWDNVSGPSAPYSVPDGDLWQALQFGSLFIVVNLNDPPQVFNVDSGSAFTDLGGSPPQARYVWAAGDFVVLGYLKVGSAEFPQDIHWSGLNDAAYWTIDRRKGSDRQTLPDGDEIVGGFGFPGGARILQRRAKRAMYFTGGQYIFEIRVLDATRGSSSPLSIVPMSSSDYVFWREDGIYRGDENIPIGAQRVDNFLLDQLAGDVDITELDTVQGVADPFNKTVMWRYLSSDGAHKVIAWDWELDRFFRIDTAALLLFSSVTPGYTLEALDAPFSSNIDINVTPLIPDPLLPPLDSRAWKGGAPTIGAFTTSNKLAYFTGAAKAWTIETATVELAPDLRSFVSGGRLKGNPSEVNMQALTATLQSEPLTASSVVARSSRTGTFPLRADAFQHRFRVIGAAGDQTFSHLHALSIDAQPSGAA